MEHGRRNAAFESQSALPSAIRLMSLPFLLGQWTPFALQARSGSIASLRRLAGLPQEATTN